MKKKWIYSVPIRPYRWGCRWLAMKLFCFLFLISVIPVSGSVYSQRQKMDISLKDVSIEALIKEIKGKVEVDFLYNIHELEKNGKVSVRMSQATVEEILREAFKHKSLDYVWQNEVIVIRAVGQADPQKGTVMKGTVRDTDGKPLPGVTVMIKGTSVGVTTDKAGHYELVKPEGEEIVLVFSFVGMKK